jgi:hypothetical protein
MGQPGASRGAEWGGCGGDRVTRLPTGKQTARIRDAAWWPAGHHGGRVDTVMTQNGRMRMVLLRLSKLDVCNAH